MRKTGPIRVVVVEPSGLVRRLLVNRLNDDQGLQVVGQAADPRDALRKVFGLQPDVLVTELDLPGVDGVGFIRDLTRRHPIPVIGFSSTAEAAARGTLVKAMEAGVVQVVDKPTAAGGVERAIDDVARAVKRASYGGRRRTTLPPPGAPVPQDGQRPRPARRTSLPPPNPTATRRHSMPPPTESRSGVDAMIGRSRALRGEAPTQARGPSANDPIIVVGSSTGGPQALMKFVAALAPDAPGVVIAQHLMEGFSQALAVRLGQVAHRPAAEARPGVLVEPGTIWLAPSTAHVRLLPAPQGFRLQVDRGDLVNGHRPSVDVLFHSVARVAGARAVGVILTGMGRDGADGLLAMRRSGAHTLGQDEVSSVVYGMPKAAYEIGGVEEQGTPAELARRACEIARRLHAGVR